MLLGDAKDLPSTGVQTPGGTGALHLALTLAARANPAARVYLPLPAWPNHLPMIQAAGLEPSTVSLFDAARQQCDFERLLGILDEARAGDAVILQATCYNPTGIDPRPEIWKALGDVVERRGLLPICLLYTSRCV